MAAGTPTVLAPAAAEVVRLETVLAVLKTPYSGAGTQRELRVQVSRTNAFPAWATNAVFDSLLREDDSHAQGDDWCEVQVGRQLPGLAAWAAATTYYCSALVRNTSSESSSWATAVTFTTAAAEVSASTWRAAQ